MCKTDKGRTREYRKALKRLGAPLPLTGVFHLVRNGNVVDPAFATSASTRQRTPTSKSVVVRLRPLSDACIKTFDRIGSVVRVLTTFCTRCNPSRIASLVTLSLTGI